MKNYGRIVTKITETPWLITPEGLTTVLAIIDRRLDGEKFSTAELEKITTKARDDNPYHTWGAEVNGRIGILPISGPIFGKANLLTMLSGATSLSEFRQDFKSMLNSDDVDAIVLDIDSPGGTSEYLQEVGDEIFAAREIKPVYSIANTMAGSAAYWLASQADKLYMAPSGLVGSVGAYRVHIDQSGKDANDGNRFTFTSAGKYKVEDSPHSPLSEEARDYRQQQVDECYNDFLSAVARGRGITTQEVSENFGQGRVVTSKHASQKGMVDGVVELESLVKQLQTAPQELSVSINGGEAIAARAQAGDGVLRLEVADWEHSEPGTGTPPIRRTDEDDKSGDRKGSGSRRDTPPIQQGNLPDGGQSPPEANSSSNNGINETSSEHGEEDSVVLNENALKALGLSSDASDEAVSSAIVSMHGRLTEREQQELKNKTFAELFPEQAAELEARREADNTAAASKFANNHKFITKLVGDDVVPTTVGLSALALETVEDTHKLIASGSTKEALESFDKCMNILNSEGGRVEYGEKGSSRPVTGSEPSSDDDNEPVEDDDNVDVKGASKLISAKALQLQTAAGGSSKMSWGDAVASACKELPLAAKIYNESLSNNGNRG